MYIRSLFIIIILFSINAFAIDTLNLKEKIINCDKGNVKSCYELGLLYAQGDRVTKDYSKSIKYFSISCDMHYPKACYLLGFINEQGEYVKQNYSKAIKYYKKSCALKYAEACDKLGWFFYKGIGVKKNYLTAKNYFSVACNQGNLKESCYFIGRMYEKGLGVKQDYFKAEEYFIKACDARNVYGCSSYISLYEKGSGSKLDSKYIELVKKGTLKGLKNKTVGECVDSFNKWENKNWDTLINYKGKKIVIFVGQLHEIGDKIYVKFVFLVNGKLFNLYSCGTKTDISEDYDMNNNVSICTKALLALSENKFN
jgi:TPR repeat protein